ncbi:MAG TPA: hypothetical protein VK936_09110 [Longimicrobiales bacterium]|nr:hypothetical protein [Longimicrobiales bacterium]
MHCRTTRAGVLVENSVKPRGPRRRLLHTPVRALAVLLVAATVAVAGCGDSPSEPAGDRYTLTAINGAPLPGPFPDVFGLATALEVTAGTLTLRSNGTFRETLTIRCRSPLPPETTCELTGPVTIEAEGVYSRADGYVRYPEGAVPDTEFATVFTDAAVTITVVLPPSQGGGASFVLEYRR